ncbi:MAG: tripartite tricarboxylate transporter substrate binding protein [Betaproteobacteria bacterium]|nr:tripartite tricarboxylate transporter substrate binding protein [Betaproteobacteria bacterium]
MTGMKRTTGFKIAMGVAGLLALAPLIAAAQTYPVKPVRILIPFPPGGPSDYAARVVGMKLTESLGQTVIADNRPGAGGLVATELGARAAPDGYTLLIANTGTFTVLPHLMTKMPYDAVRDFTPIVNLIAGPAFLLVHPSVPVKNLRELIALAKKMPGQITHGSAGIGQSSHLNGELLKQLAGIDFLQIPYKGSGPILPELIGGQLMMHFSTSVDNLQFVKSGRVRALAVTGKTRLSVAPDLPTMAESGLPGFESLNWNGIVGPAGLSRDIVTRLNQEMVRVLNLPDVKEKIIAQGNYVVGDTPEQFAAFMRAESEKWARVAKLGNIKLE